MNKNENIVCGRELTLDEAIAHADEVAGDCSTSCKREHKQLADWLRELKSRRSAEYGDAAKLREALTKILNLTNSLDENCAVDPVEIRDIAKAALAAPPASAPAPSARLPQPRLTCGARRTDAGRRSMSGYSPRRLWEARNDAERTQPVL